MATLRTTCRSARAFQSNTRVVCLLLSAVSIWVFGHRQSLSSGYSSWRDLVFALKVALLSLLLDSCPLQNCTSSSLKWCLKDGQPTEKVLGHLLYGEVPLVGSLRLCLGCTVSVQLSLQSLIQTFHVVRAQHCILCVTLTSPGLLPLR